MRNMGKIILGVAISVAFVGIYLGTMQGHVIDGTMQELQSVQSSTDEAEGQPVDQAGDQSENQAADETADRSADGAADETAEQAADEAADGTEGQSSGALTAKVKGQETEEGELEQKADRVLLSVEPIMQYPELPTGCEVTSLAMALRYADCEVSKTVLADEYLPKCGEGEKNFSDYFWGDPRRDDAYGCLAPAVVTCAENYLHAVGSDLVVYDLSGKSFPELYEELRQGRPVVVWGCMDPNWEIVYTEVIGENGRVYEWPANEHCMLLIGFDLEKGTVTVNDPLKGVSEYTIGTFARHYNNIGMQAVVIA